MTTTLAPITYDHLAPYLKYRVYGPDFSPLIAEDAADVEKAIQHDEPRKAMYFYNKLRLHAGELTLAEYQEIQ